MVAVRPPAAMQLRRSPSRAPEGRRGAALMLSFMVLLVLILILAQIKYSTDTSSRVARNEEALVAMDSAIESALLQVFEDLKTDAESDAAAGEGPGEGLGGLGAGSGAGGDAAAAAESAGGGPTDSKEDEWARPQRTELNEIQLRILIQDEDSKFNVLSVLTEDDDEAEKAVERLARVIEWSRKGTEAEIDGSTARRMADAMTDHMRRRRDQVLPKPELLSDREGEDDLGAPLSLREFVALDPELFPYDLFKDFVDEDGDVVHSLGSFLTVWSSVGTVDDASALDRERGGGADEPPGEEPEEEPPPGEDATDGAPDEGSGGGGGRAGSGGSGGGAAGEEPPPGWAINVNTAPGAVLHGLLDSRDLPYRFWDDVILYRNEKDETVEENEDPPLDEYGREIIVKQYFRSIDDLAEIDGWENLEPIVQGELRGLLKTQSSVFSVFVTARKPTGDEQIDPFARQEDIEREEADWQGLVRTVRAVVWRRTLGEGEVEILPIVRWEVLDYVPFEVLDFPGDRGFR